MKILIFRKSDLFQKVFWIILSGIDKKSGVDISCSIEYFEGLIVEITWSNSFWKIKLEHLKIKKV